MDRLQMGSDRGYVKGMAMHTQNNASCCAKCGRQIDLARYREGETLCCPVCFSSLTVVVSARGNKFTADRRGPTEATNGGAASQPVPEHTTAGSIRELLDNVRRMGRADRPVYILAAAGLAFFLIGVVVIALLNGMQSSRTQHANAALERASGKRESSADEASRSQRPPSSPESRAGGALSSPQVAPRSMESLVREFDPSVCKIDTATGSGTGFVVGPQLIATNEHVVGIELPDELTFTFPADGRRHAGAELVYAADGVDLLVLHVASIGDLKPLPIHPTAELNKGEKIFVIGCPGGLRNVVTDGILGSIQELDGQEFLQLSASVNPGNSGGPAVSLRGKVAGVVTMKAASQEGIAYAIPGDALIAALAFLDEHDGHVSPVQMQSWQSKRLATELVRSGRRSVRVLAAYDEIATAARSGGLDLATKLAEFIGERKEELGQLRVVRQQAVRLLGTLDETALEPEKHALLVEFVECFRLLGLAATEPDLAQLIRSLKRPDLEPRVRFEAICDRAAVTFGIEIEGVAEN